MRILYNIFVLLYIFAAHIAALGSPKAKLWIKGRRGLLHKIHSQMRADERRIWFHCASLGEFEQGRPLIERIKQRHPEYKIVLTFFSPSGYEIRKNYEYADYIYYLPYDRPMHVKLFLKAVKPEMIFFIKYDFWFNYIHQAYKMGIPFYSVSCIFRPGQIYFRLIGRWMLKQLRQITRFYVQDSVSMQLLQEHNIPQTEIAGDTRFDRVSDIIRKAQKYPDIEHFCNHQFTLICGSTWIPDEVLIAKLFHKHPDIKLIIAPHEIDEQRIFDLERVFIKYKVLRYTQMESTLHLNEYNVLIIDTIGMLSSLYYYGNIAYIGGGFGKGIHNILEAATYGKPVLFGPNYHKFKEAVDLIQLQGACSINKFQDLEQQFLLWKNDASAFMQASEITAQYVRQHTQAAELIYNSVFKN